MRYYDAMLKYFKEKNMSDYKAGDRVIITANKSGHGFLLGTEVVLGGTKGEWHCAYLDGRDYWWVDETEFKPANSEPWAVDPIVPDDCGDGAYYGESGKLYNNVSKPAHYNHGEGIECIDYIKQVLGKEGFVAYCRGNQMKYQHRAFYKGNPVEDMEKAHQYQAWAIETLKEIHK